MYDKFCFLVATVAAAWWLCLALDLVLTFGGGSLLGLSLLPGLVYTMRHTCAQSPLLGSQPVTFGGPGKVDSVTEAASCLQWQDTSSLPGLFIPLRRHGMSL